MSSNLFKTKTFWAGIATIATGVAMMTQGDVVQGVQTITLGILAICGRDAVGKVGG